MPYRFEVLKGRFAASFARAAAGRGACGGSIFPGAALAATPAVPASFIIEPVASATVGASNCDDLARLGAHLFFGCQNATMSTGGGGNSMLVEYSAGGTTVNSWSLPDKIDGLGADPKNHRVIVTFNEDGNSHLATINPSAPPGQQVANYNYAPVPDAAGSGPLLTGAGTDSVVVDGAGNIYIVASAPSNTVGTAVFRVVLSAGTARLYPRDRRQRQRLGHRDPGPDGPRLERDRARRELALRRPVRDHRQTSNQLVFSSNIYAATGLTALSTTENGTPTAFDDIRWSTADRGTLVFVNDKTNTIYKISGPFGKATARTSNATNASEIATVNLATGALTPFASGLSTPKGLLFVTGGHDRDGGDRGHGGSSSEGDDGS